MMRRPPRSTLFPYTSLFGSALKPTRSTTRKTKARKSRTVSIVAERLAELIYGCVQAMLKIDEGILWPEDTFVDFEHSLNAAVNKLREALGDDANSPRLPRLRFSGCASCWLQRRSEERRVGK